MFAQILFSSEWQYYVIAAAGTVVAAGVVVLAKLCAPRHGQAAAPDALSTSGRLRQMRF
jgi:hypothetical protein